ncbi:unnamed protein product [Polarella glacialis]|uniref:Apple domain-containing protein n=1 Tax=Polarella glacialis TaxID=89957 RepID=A0A813DEE9_POLGL|nr:unnamed protein product [Polarella glacialis]
MCVCFRPLALPQPNLDIMLRLSIIVLVLKGAESDDPQCWSAGVSQEQCCNLALGPMGDDSCWEPPTWTFERCCGPPPPRPSADVLAQPYPDCRESGVVHRHAAAHAIFEDLSFYGHAGCFQNNCKLTDKFNAEDPSLCARVCAQVEACEHWTFGTQDGVTKCFLRKSDDARQSVGGWVSGAKSCAPPPIPGAQLALATVQSAGIMACDKGKGPECPDLGAAINTWIFAIQHLQKATAGMVDEGTLSHILGIAEDSKNFQAGLTAEYRPTDKDYGRMVYNNRMIFNHLTTWLEAQPKVELDPSDSSVPNPLRTGQLCGKASCFEKRDQT